MKTPKSEIEKGRVEMNIHILWNKCVDKTTDISSCIELYTKRIIKEKNEKFDKILDEIRNRFAEDIEDFREHHTITRSLYPENFTYFIEEIKQKIKENEE